MNRYLRGVLKLPKVLKSADYFSLAFLLLVIGSVSGLWWRQTVETWPLQPLNTGVYTEGIVNQDPYNLDLVIAKLTKIGLTYTDHQQHLQGALADHWNVSQDGKVYTFILRPGVDAQAVASAYRALPDWQNIDIRVIDSQTIQINLRQPFAPLLSFTSNPIFGQGPYIKDKQTKNQLVFLANSHFVLGQPHLQKIVLSIYPDSRSLKAAVQRQEVMGVDIDIGSQPGLALHHLSLTKQTALFFNLERPVFKDKKIRQAIRDHQHLDRPLTVTLVTNQDPNLLAWANQFSDQMRPLGLTVSISSINPIVLDRDIVPDDNYDLLLTDLNYGYDHDPYPYWHSSQIVSPGKNYAGYNNREVDNLIEQARQTSDQTAREAQYDRIQALLDQDIPAIFYPTQSFDYLVSQRIKGVADGIGVAPADRYTEVWRWYLRATRQRPRVAKSH